MKQTQRLIMTPQMQQSIQLLQMNSMDLETMIHTEMMENPFLELADDEEGLRTEEAPAEAAEIAEAPAETGLSEQAAPEAPWTAEEPPETEAFDSAPPASESPTDPLQATQEGSEEFERMAEADVDWAEQYDDSDTVSFASTREDIEENDFTTYTRASESLYDSLSRQLQLSSLRGKDLKIGEFIVGNIDDNGYIDSALPNQCLMLGYPPELVMPSVAGSVERVDEYLRRLLARLRGGENPDAFVGMKRREIVARIVATLLGLPYDQVASMNADAQMRRLIARKLKVAIDEIASLPPAELLLDVIAHRTKSDRDRVFDVLETVQEFEPTGVGARDISECLRLQCEEKGIRNRLLYRILESHFPDLQQKRFKEIARDLQATEQEVSEVFTTLSKLDPRPGSTITKDRPKHITPDVYVKKVEGKYLYFMNEGDASKLKIASTYRRLMQNGKAVAPAEQVAEPQEAKPIEHDYAHEKYRSAIWLIRNIEKRKSTILRVTEAIMEFQKDFLEKGIEFLHPLTLREIAERVGMHESTIARVKTKKFVETPRGVFPLEFFFSSGLETDEGEAASSRSIKELLTQMIEAEDKSRPLSDQKLADMLRARGFQIARRTVAKYREQIKILPAKLRKDV